MDGRGDRAQRWLIAGGVCAGIGWVLWVAMQIIAKDPFPPKISVSQYGLGPFGWVFTVWAVALAAAPLLLLRSNHGPSSARIPMWIGFAAAVVMAVVRTDDGGGPMSWHAWLHMCGAIVAMVFLPLGILIALRSAGRRVRRVADPLAVAGLAAAALLVLSAAGVDTAGLGSARSWALWQGVLVVIDMVLVTIYAVAACRSMPT